jgi:AcrR family transcriptional regulator
VTDGQPVPLALPPPLALPRAGRATAGFSRGSRLGENTAVDKIPDNGGEQPGGAAVRRHGAELERAILDAAWEQLVAEGYEHFTFDAVAARAQTSKPVLYRRWKTREDLLRATARRRGAADPPAVPDTGTLRGDLLTLLGYANTTRNPMVALVSSMLASYYNQTGPPPAELREAFLTPRGSVVEQVVNRAVERGEIDPARLTPRIINLPFDLFRNEMMMTLTTVPDHVLRQIVDDIFIPLVSPRPVPPAEGTVLQPYPPVRGLCR